MARRANLTRLEKLIVKTVRCGPEHAQIANVIADALDEGQILWRTPHLPRHVNTGEVFGGVNPLLLQIAAHRLGCTSPFWGSIAAWHSLGCKVIQPQAAAHVFRADPPALETVCNWNQTDRAFTPPALTYDSPADVLESIVSRVGVRLDFGWDATCKYVGAEDRIQMPHKLMFAWGPGGETGFMDALAHELFHASERRVGWEGSYELNELRAEVGSGLLLGALGVPPLPLSLARHHRRFAPAWSLLIRFQPSLVFRVANDVCATLDWLLELVGKSIPWEVSSLSFGFTNLENRPGRGGMRVTAP